MSKLTVERIQARKANAHARLSEYKLRPEHDSQGYKTYAAETDILLCDAALASLRGEEPIGEIVCEEMGVPGSNAMRVTVSFYAAVPPVGTKIFARPPAAQWVSMPVVEVEIKDGVWRGMRFLNEPVEGQRILPEGKSVLHYLPTAPGGEPGGES